MARHHRSDAKWAALGAAIVTAAALVWLAFPPAPGPAGLPAFSGQVKTRGSLPCGYGCSASFAIIPIPPNVTVAVRWVDLTGGVVDFAWIPGQGAWNACGSTGPLGWCVFDSSGGNYTFGAFDVPHDQPRQLVNFTGSYV